jgi:hypothetical protein
VLKNEQKKIKNKKYTQQTPNEMKASKHASKVERKISQ